MTWVKVDDRFPEHAKALAAGDEACWMFITSLCYSGRNLTDGFIPAGQVQRLTGLKNPSKLAEALVEVGLWDAVDGGYRVHNYTDYQPSKEQVRNRRETTAQRVRKHRSNGVTEAEVTPLTHAGAGARTAGVGYTGSSSSVVDAVEDACAQVSDERLVETVAILKTAPRLGFDPELMGVANTLLAHPKGDHRKAAHIAVANVSDPNYRTTDAGRALHYAFAQLEREGPRPFAGQSATAAPTRWAERAEQWAREDGEQVA